jgi:hypothetical protein
LGGWSDESEENMKAGGRHTEKTREDGQQKSLTYGIAVESVMERAAKRRWLEYVEGRRGEEEARNVSLA